MTISVSHFMRRPRPNVYSIERLYEDIRAGMPSDCEVVVWSCRFHSKGLLPRLKDLWAARRQQRKVNHVTGDVHFLTYLLDRDRTILTIHDLVLLERFDGVRRFVIWLLWYWLPIKRSRTVVTISETTRRALIKAVPSASAKIRVIHNNVSDEFQHSPRRFCSKAPRILQVGTKENKNIERVARALSGLECRLVIIGKLSATQVQVLDEEGIEYESYHGLSREELVQSYIASDLLMFVSTYEGFGLPVVEAQAIGRPVVTSKIDPMPEVAGDGACFVDPFDIESIREGVVKVITDDQFREGLVQAGLRNVERFRLQVVAEKYAELYREICDAARCR